jgi:molybdate transport system ATP-binding protein
MTLAIRLTHTFRGFDLQVDFTAPPGVTALFGRSGSGKTTVVNAVAGLLHPQAGRISVNDRVLLDTAARVNLPVHRRRIGYVFQDARLFPHLSVQQNLLYGRRFAAVGTGPSLDQITDFLGIEALLHRRTAALSGGEKQRVAIGRAILSNPDLLLMDEPLAALDDPRKTEILPYLERLRDDLGLPILYVSHSMAEVARLATTVVLMDAGRITAIGPTDALLSDPATAPLIGLREAGAVITARMTAREADGLSLLETSAGPLWLPRVSAPPGTTLRLRILAQDVILSRDRPTGLSALNILPGRILDIRTGDGPGALVRVQIGEDVLLARITRRSATALALTPGLPVHAILKAVSVPRENIGA